MGKQTVYGQNTRTAIFWRTFTYWLARVVPGRPAPAPPLAHPHAGSVNVLATTASLAIETRHSGRCAGTRRSASLLRWKFASANKVNSSQRPHRVVAHRRSRWHCLQPQPPHPRIRLRGHRHEAAGRRRTGVHHRAVALPPQSRAGSRSTGRFTGTSRRGVAGRRHAHANAVCAETHQIVKFG